jgi:type I restriction enzyme S subunit
MNEALLKDLIQYSRDGEWGPAEPTLGHTAMRVIRGTDFEAVRCGEIVDLPIRYIPNRRAELKSLRVGDVLIETAGGTADRPTGRSVLIRPAHIAASDLPLCCASFARFVRVDVKLVEPAYLQLWLENSWNSRQLLAFNTQHTGVARFQWTTCAETIAVPLPPLECQARVAEPILVIDDLIRNSRRRVEVLEEMARAIYREWFVRFRYPGHESVPLVDSPLGPIPDGWAALPSAEALDINPKVQLKRGTPCRYMAMAELSERTMNCSPGGWKESPSGSKFVNGDTLFARITPCLENGKTGFVQALADGEAACGSTEFIVIRGRLVGPCFAYLLARYEDFRGHAISTMSGASGRQRVRTECFDSFMVAAPPLAVAAQFEEVMKPVFRHSWVLHQQALALASLRYLLLPELVAGKIDLSHLDLDGLTEAAIG